MFVQSVMAWVVLSAGVLLMLAGLASGTIFTQPLWTGSGVLKMALFTAVYAALALLAARFRPRLFLPALGLLAAGYSMLAVGPLAVIGAAWLLAGSFATGAWILQTRLKFIAKYPQVVILLGLAVWAVFVAFTAQWPIHHAWLYWLIFLLPMYQVLRLRLVQGAWPAVSEPGRDTDWSALAIFPAAVHWMVALKPEVSADGLAMHLVVAARMAARHFWSFDGSEFAWAVKPMNGDWIWSIAYTLGGEGAAKLMNALILALICWLLYTWLHEMIPARLSALLTAGFASTPLVQRVTGSLDVENVAAAFLLAGLIFLPSLPEGAVAQRRHWPRPFLPRAGGDLDVGGWHRAATHARGAGHGSGTARVLQRRARICRGLAPLSDRGVAHGQPDFPLHESLLPVAVVRCLGAAD